MKRFIIISIVYTLLSLPTQLTSAPWLIFENNTPTSFVCEVKVLCKNDQPLTLHSSNDNPQIAVKIEEKDDSTVQVNFRFEFEALKKVSFQPIFFSNETTVLPQIIDIFIESPLLQSIYHFDISDQDDRYFTVALDDKNCIQTTSQGIGVFTKIKSNFKCKVLAWLNFLHTTIEKL